MSASDRLRIATQLAKEVELAAAKAAADQVCNGYSYLCNGYSY